MAAWHNGNASDYDASRNQEIAGSIPAVVIFTTLGSSMVILLHFANHAISLLFHALLYVCHR